MQQVREQVTQGTPTGLYCPELCCLSPFLGLSHTLFSDCFGPPAGPQEYYPGCRSLALCKGLDWLPSVAMGNSPLSLHHHLLPIIGRRGPCVLGGGVFSQERCVTLAQPPRPWGLAPFQGCIVPPHWLHLVRFFCSAASPHLGLLGWKAPAQHQQQGRKKASRHPCHLTRFQKSGLEFCSFLSGACLLGFTASPLGLLGACSPG